LDVQGWWGGFCFLDGAQHLFDGGGVEAGFVQQKHGLSAQFAGVKHGLSGTAADWPFSSFHRCVRRGLYPRDWAGAEPDIGEVGERSA
jgi:hypothetical protein